MTSAGQSAELAGMVLGKTALHVGAAYPMPAARLENGLLRWSAHGPAAEADPIGLLDAFIRMRDGNDVLRFAQQFGVLGICEHGWPASHNPPPLPAPSTGVVTWCYPIGWPDVAEPVDRWLSFAERARALLHLSSNLLDGQRLDRQERQEAWKVVYRDHARPRGNSWLAKFADSLAQSRGLGITHLAVYLNDWLAFGNARPALIWRAWEGRSEPAFELRATGAFGIMSIQLATAIARAHGVSVCDGCAMTYPRAGRPPQAGRRNYCPACKADKIDERDRKRRSRAIPKRKGGGRGKTRKR